MSRMLRIDLPKTIYHVFSRGNNKNAIFVDNKDYNVFLKQLFEVKSEKDFSLYAYCLMPNHFHLLIETVQEPLSRIMQKLLTLYGIYFNSTYDRSGHVFQGRYKAVICQKEEYLFKLLQYIHLNPLRAGLTKDINGYKWSSHLICSGKINNKNLSLEKLFQRMDCRSITEGRKTYNNLINEHINEETINSFDIKFNKILLQYNYSTLHDILEKILIGTKISKNDILSKSQNREVNKARKEFSFEAVNHGYTLKEIADFINRDASVVCKYVRDLRNIKLKNLKKSAKINFNQS